MAHINTNPQSSVGKSVTSWFESRTYDNYRIPLSGTQFLRMPPKDPQGTIDTHSPFEIKTFKSVYDYIYKILDNTEKYTNILAEFCLKNGLKSLVKMS